MALRGTLQSFPPSEILQFLTNSRRTGTLRVYDETDTKLLSFRDGQLVFAIHQRRAAPLRDLILHRGHANAEELPGANEQQQGWDEAVSRALARRRNLDGNAPRKERRREKLHTNASDAQLGHVLVAQGKLTEEQLQAALEPAAIPEKLLVASLRGAGLVSDEALLAARTSPSGNRPLYEILLHRQRVSHDEVVEMVSRMSDESVAELLVYQGHLSRTEAVHCLNQLETLRDSLQRGVRSGEYLLAKGLITASQLQRALFDQVAKEERLGDTLVGQGALSEEVLAQTLDQAAALRTDFGPMNTLHVRTSAAASHEMTEARQREIVQSVLVDELCDLVLWADAQFEFLEGFSLKHVLSPLDLPDLPDFAFEVQSLLLETHTLLDELKCTAFAHLSPSTVLTTGAAATDFSAKEVPGILRRIDGRRSLEEVCAVLPGNGFSHLLLFTELLEGGLVRPLSRNEAFAAGQESIAAGHAPEAVCLFRHALASPGDEPPDPALRTALRDAQWSTDKHPLGFLVLTLKRGVRALGLFGAYEALRHRVVESPVLGRLRAALIAPVLRTARRSLARTGTAFETVLIRTGLARHVWSLKARLAPIATRLPGLANPTTGSLMAGVIAVVLIAYLIPGVPDLPKFADPRPAPPVASEPPVEQRAAIGSFAVGGPVEVAPTLHAKSIYVAARDGKIRALSYGPEPAAAEGRLKVLWEVAVGEFGDILNQPLVAAGKVIATSVRGRVLAISDGGVRLWQRELPRLEPIQPVPIFGDAADLLGIAVVSREKALVLSPEDGRTLFELATGNRIIVPPVGDAGILIVGSSDNHVYAADWQQGELLWDHEERDDIIALVRAGGRLLFAARDGALAALDPTTGQQLWKRNLERDSIRRVAPLAADQVHVEMDSGRLATVDAANGQTVADYQPDPGLDMSRLRFAGGRRIYASNSGHLGALDASGAPRWRSAQPVGDVTGWSCQDDLLAVTNRQGKVVLFRLATAAPAPMKKR